MDGDSTSLDGEEVKLVLDITPMVKLQAVDADDGSKDPVAIEGTEKPLPGKENMEPVEISIKLPSSAFSTSESTYIHHKDMYVYTATYNGTSGAWTFTNPHGFSTFVASKKNGEAQIAGDGFAYATLAGAVANAKDGDTITLQENVGATTVTLPSGVTTLTINKNSKECGEITATNGNVIEEDGTITITKKSTQPPTGGPGGSTGTSGNITVTKPANGSMTSNVSSAKEGDKVTVTVKPDAPYYIVTGITVKGENGNVVATKNADGTYSFTMPKGSVTVNATISHIYNLFKDVPTEIAEYGTAIKWAVEKGITLGTDTVAYSTFSPYNPCTRGQMVTFLHRNHSKPEVSGSNDFNDVPADAFYKDAVQWAVDNGITNGTGEGTFAPDDACTRVQMVTFLYRDMGK
ncbi:S-layer homology domain-containing protein [Oscillospiraceae bacterium 21-37]